MIEFNNTDVSINLDRLIALSYKSTIDNLKELLKENVIREDHIVEEVLVILI